MAPSRWFGGLKMGGMAFSGGNILQRSGIATPVAMSPRRMAALAGIFVAVSVLSARVDGLTAQAQTAALTAPANASADLMAVYTITGVPVDATAGNAVQARERAVSEGQKAAFRHLAARLSGQQARDSVSAPTDAELPSLVLGVAVETEKTSAVRYFGTISVSFFPDAAKKRLQAAGLPVFDTPAKPMVVLPIFQAAPDAPAQLFDDRSPWKAVWSGRPRSGLTPLIVPSGDLSDIATLDATKALALDQTGLTAMMQRYRTEDAVVVKAVLTGDGVTRRIDLSLARPGGPFQSLGSVPAPTSSSLTAALDAASDSIADWLDTQWRSQAGSAVSLIGSGTMTITVSLPGGLPDWLSTRQVLSQQIISGWSLQSLTSREAVITVSHRGAASDLVQAMAQSGLTLADDGTGNWTLSKGAPPAGPGAAAGAAPGQPAPNQPTPSQPATVVIQ